MRNPGRINQDLRALMRRLEQARARGRQIGRYTAGKPEPERSRIGAGLEPQDAIPPWFPDDSPGDEA